MAEKPIPPITWDEYQSIICAEYESLLKDGCADEKGFQSFFERHPSIVPGSFELFGSSGHFPYLDCLISQPEIGSLFGRKPDFVWLSQDSLTFCPVFIEIENPCKRTFTQAGLPSAEINQALDQIREWKMILDNPTNRLLLYDYFELPEYMRQKQFSPQYGLIYGRRSEYENSVFLTKKRANMQTQDIAIMSYDRLVPQPACKTFLCMRIAPSMTTSRYHVITIPPTFMYSPHTSEILSQVTGFCDQIENMAYTTDDRKKILLSRYEYWYNYGKRENKGIIYSGDKE